MSSSPQARLPTSHISKGIRGTNVALDYNLRRGDVEAGFASADRVFEHTFRSQQVMHTPLEPFVAVADAGEGRVTIYTASQGPSFVRIEIARLLGLPENRVRVKVPYLGGGFGGKLYMKLEPLVTALSMIARRPVKVALTMEEQFFMVTRHPCTFTIKSGVNKDGKIVARKCDRDLEWRRLCRHRPARDAEGRLHLRRSLRHRERLDRFIRGLHQPSAGGRVAWFRRAADGVGLRLPHGPDRGSARHG